jgi:hypothetical protein
MQWGTNREIKSVSLDSMKQIFSLEEISEDFSFFVWFWMLNILLIKAYFFVLGHER